MNQGIAQSLQTKLCKVLPRCLIQCSADPTGDLTVVAKPLEGDAGWVITGFNAKDLDTPEALDQAVWEIFWEIREGLHEQ
ncbi:hypothetical protein DM872_10505 [Pseudomonas taiwanensis]|uniref:hypothetical protein n=1 Tax=Pseudomonas taiwanensis TaxID=470150 RepID=UPI0015C08E2C|nr:hypothetical protein [Pseudomonas taiwanensis]NWL77285.1 hypothetical protein [Pseudomonas taiwanensis]